MDPDAVPDVDPAVHGGAENPHLCDFSANVNPERPPGVAGVYESALAASRRYPTEADAESFREAAAAHVDCDPDAVIPTAGGTAAIRLAVETAVSPGETALLPAPSFGEYAREVRLAGGEPTFVAHDRVLDSDPADHALAVVCTPNNPTGELTAPTELREFAKRCRDAGTTLLVDEAFLEFTTASSLAGTPGVVVARSLTKAFGLPGLRAGFAVATGRHRERLVRARQPWSMSTPATLVGTHCLGHSDFLTATRDRVARERERMRETLANAFDVFPSDAPFLLLDVRDRDVDTVLQRARDRGIVLRDARSFRRLDNHVRVAVRRPDENDRLLDVLTAL